MTKILRTLAAGAVQNSRVHAVSAVVQLPTINKYQQKHLAPPPTTHQNQHVEEIVCCHELTHTTT